MRSDSRVLEIDAAELATGQIPLLLPNLLHHSTLQQAEEQRLCDLSVVLKVSIAQQSH